MLPRKMLPILQLLLFTYVANGETVQTTKLFIVPIEPTIFNWTDISVTDEYEYNPSLLRSPDLPSWMHYLYSRRDRRGYLYGVVPPDHSHLENISIPCKKSCAAPRIIKQGRIQVLVVGMNRETYETRKRVIHLNVQEKIPSATHQINIKIDNINVDDLFDPYRMTRFLDIFRDKLWPKSFADLYVTFLASAVTQGARRPLKPNESEGVVIKIGSTAEFSNKLQDLQEEVKPLVKKQPCPRDFKRTTVERWFRDEGFILDWCSFKLIYPMSPTVTEPPWLPPSDLATPAWLEMSRSNLPQRSYSEELTVAILVPMLLMAVFVIMVSFVLCLQHEGTSKMEEISEEQLTHYVAVQRATSTLRSLSRNREITPDSTVIVNDDATRPNPPPYTGTLRSNKADM